jgi:DNA-binding response OmpR family regulator
MNSEDYTIVFFDNSINRIFKTIELVKQNYKHVFVFNEENDFFDFIEKEESDVVFLNLDLSPNDAVIITKEIKGRKLNNNPFIVIYSEKQDDFAQEIALNSGADAFINFHLKPAVVLLFLKNLVKRRPSKLKQKNNDIIIDNEKHLIFNKGLPVQLPRKEFKVFELLYNHPDKFFSKIDIAQQVWQDESVAGKRTIDVHIYNIRCFFGKRIIQSQKGRGYRMTKKVIN